jgi:hypothetical protein
MSAAANGGRAGSMDGGRMGQYKLNQIRGTVYKNQVEYANNEQMRNI